MKTKFRLLVILILVLFLGACTANRTAPAPAPITNPAAILGSWSGYLNVMGNVLKVVFHLALENGQLTASMDSPLQGAFGIEADRISFEHGILEIHIAAAGLLYSASLEDGMLKGTFSQGAFKTELILERQEAAMARPKRPQEPQPPFPYHVEDVIFENSSAGIKLAGTLTLPSARGSFPAVVLISGSGPQNRDEEIYGHKPFWVIADFLSRNGIAVLRYDDRGVAKSGGDYASATTYDFASDAEAAVRYLSTRPEIISKAIGLAGHSEGGIIAPIVAARNPNVAFAILLAGTGLSGEKIIMLQQALIGRSMGASEEELQKAALINAEIFELVRSYSDKSDLEKILRERLTKFAESGELEVPEGFPVKAFVEQQVSQIASPWMSTFLTLDPVPYLEKVSVPVLALNGDRDLQVPATQNLSAIQAALERAGNHDVTIMELEGLNHLFQQVETGTIDEYGSLEETFSQEALDIILAWLKERVPTP